MAGTENGEDQQPVDDFQIDAQILDFINTQLNGGLDAMLGKWSISWEVSWWLNFENIFRGSTASNKEYVKNFPLLKFF